MGIQRLSMLGSASCRVSEGKAWGFGHPAFEVEMLVLRLHVLPARD